jgi:hypothetical protein
MNTLAHIDMVLIIWVAEQAHVVATECGSYLIRARSQGAQNSRLAPIPNLYVWRNDTSVAFTLQVAAHARLPTLPRSQRRGFDLSA